MKTELSLLMFLLFVVFGRTDDDGLRFYVLGDWGGQNESPFTTDLQHQVASQMSKHASSFDPKFIAVVGDNFYDDGITTNVFDHRFRDTFENVYHYANLQCRWYITLGNHDWNGNATAQVAYTDHSTRWYLPNFWYTTTLNVPNSDSTAQFIFYDTQIFADMNTTELYQEQFQWIKNTLASSKADWLFVIGHYPVWSVGSHGPTPALLRDLMPLLHQYKVDAYIGGHEHNMEHIRDDLYPIDYFIAGAGGHDTSHKAEHSTSVPPNSLKFFWPTSKEVAKKSGAFMTMSVHSDHMKMQFVDDQGNHLYDYSKPQSRFGHHFKSNSV